MSRTLPDREAMEFDVVVVGAGPAGLAAAIRLKQLPSDVSVVVVEKGSEVGAHILSGAVIDPSASTGCCRIGATEDAPIKTPVTDDRFYFLTRDRRHSAAELHDAAADEQSRQLHRLARQRLPLAGDQGRSAGRRNLSGLCRRRKFCIDDNGAVRGIATGDMGIGKNGEPNAGFTRGMELHAQIHVVRRRRARLSQQAA